MLLLDASLILNFMKAAWHATIMVTKPNATTYSLCTLTLILGCTGESTMVASDVRHEGK